LAGGLQRTVVLLALGSLGCERGCARSWLRDHGVGGPTATSTPGHVPVAGIDCPDGIARCTEGTVETSRLARIGQPCRGPETACSCPWDRVGDCARGCVADGLEVVMDRSQATRQLCLPDPTATASRMRGQSADDAGPPAATCEEGQLYRCANGFVVDCSAHAVLGSCTRGCFTEGASIGEVAREETVSRVAAFAILCSR